MNNTKSGIKVFLAVAGLSLVVYLIMDFNTRMAELRRLSADREQVKVQHESQIQTKAALETLIAYVTSDAAVEDWAYNEGNLVRPGDNPVVPLPAAQVTPTPTLAPTPTSTEVSNFQKWLDLFFGPRNP